MIWKTIDKNGRYSVSDNGIVKRNSFTITDKMGRIHCYEEKILKQHSDQDGYKTVSLISGFDKPKLCKVHRLVAQAFIPNPDELPCVNHINENKADNNVDNLEWCTVLYNNLYNDRAKKVGRKTSKPVYQYSLEGFFIKKWNNAQEVYRETGYLASNICSCCNGKLNTAYKYIWKYKLIKHFDYNGKYNTR